MNGRLWITLFVSMLIGFAIAFTYYRHNTNPSCFIYYTGLIAGAIIGRLYKENEDS